MKDPLLALVSLKPLEEIITAAKETIRRHRRRFLQHNLRPCPANCKKAEMVGHKVVGCFGCGSPNSDRCLKESKFVPLFTKDELAHQFANQLRNPEVLLREYRDVTVFLWVLGAFDKQKKTVDEHIVSKVEQREDRVKKMAVGQTGGGDNPDSALDVRELQSGPNNPATGNGTPNPVPDDDKRPAADNVVPHRVISRSAPRTK